VDALTVLRWMVAMVLAAAFLGVAGFNWGVLIRGLRGRAPSWIPLVAGVLGAAAALIEPSGVLRPWGWAAFVVDAGSIPGGALTVWALARR
jgi:hypothetical protein